MAGLGNPGEKYNGTRHNYGFSFIDMILADAERRGTLDVLNGKKFNGLLYRVNLPELDSPWLCVKPLTYMNNSGDCIQPLLSWYGMPGSKLLVAHDELDIKPGQLKLKFGGGNAGHRGLESISQRLASSDYYRLRIGIGKPPQKDNILNWVLGKANDSVMKISLDSAKEVFLLFVQKGLSCAQSAAKKFSDKNSIGEVASPHIC